MPEGLKRRAIICEKRPSAANRGILGGLLATLLIAASAVMTGCPAPGHVGNAVCLQCHDGGNASDASQFPQSAHAALQCESCHGPGKAHVEGAGRVPALIDNPGNNPVSTAYALCQSCHPGQVADYLKSAHFTSGLVRCTDCHDVHTPQTTVKSIEDNALCLQCHGPQFATDAAVEAHTFHAVDPAGTGASRCAPCHMVPQRRDDQANGPHDHSMAPISPITSNSQSPALPNSCSGVMGCHDGSVVTAPVFDLDDADLNAALQTLWDARYGAK